MCCCEELQRRPHLGTQAAPAPGSRRNTRSRWDDGQKTLRNRRLHCNVSDQTHNKGGEQKISMNMTRQKGMSILLSKTESEEPPLARKVMVPVSVAKQEFDAAVGTDASKGRMGQTLAGRCPATRKETAHTAAVQTHVCGEHVRHVLRSAVRHCACSAL